MRPTTISTTPTPASRIPPQQQGQTLSFCFNRLSSNVSPYNSNDDSNNQSTPTPYQQQVTAPFGFQGTVPASSFSSGSPSSSASNNSFTFSPIFGGGDSAQDQHHTLQPLTEPRDVRMHGCLAGDRDEWRNIPMQFSKIAKDGGRGGR